MIDKKLATGARKYLLQGVTSCALASLALSASLLYPGVVADALAQESIRPAYTADFVAQMLDYVSRDYALAVSNGIIIDQDEYVEQLVGSGSALVVSDQVKAIRSQPAIRKDIARLIELIKEMAQPAAIKKQALKARDAIYVATGTATAPRNWPSLTRGFSSLAEDELWAVSFYVLSLRPRMELPVAAKLDRTAADLWLEGAATLPDEELMHTLPGSSSERLKSLALLRPHSEDRK